MVPGKVLCPSGGLVRPAMSFWPHPCPVIFLLLSEIPQDLRLILTMSGIGTKEVLLPKISIEGKYPGSFPTVKTSGLNHGQLQTGTFSRRLRSDDSYKLQEFSPNRDVVVSMRHFLL